MFLFKFLNIFVPRLPLSWARLPVSDDFHTVTADLTAAHGYFIAALADHRPQRLSSDAKTVQTGSSPALYFFRGKNGKLK